MINFVLVEDNTIQRKKVVEIINKVMMPNNRNYVINEFSDYDSKLSKMIAKDDKYKIYILDFELPSSTAIEIAREIRECDWISPIIINSAYPSLAYETFKQRLQILDFVTKQIDSEKNLIELINLCLKQFDIKKPVRIKVGHNDIRLLPSKVLYFYKENRKSIIVCENDNYAVCTTLEELQKDFGSSFVQAHKACYINVDRVKKYNWKDKIITFDNGMTCELLSHNFREELYKYDH